MHQRVSHKSDMVLGISYLGYVNGLSVHVYESCSLIEE